MHWYGIVSSEQRYEYHRGVAHAGEVTGGKIHEKPGKVSPCACACQIITRWHTTSRQAMWVTGQAAGTILQYHQGREGVGFRPTSAAYSSGVRFSTVPGMEKIAMV